MMSLEKMILERYTKEEKVKKGYCVRIRKNQIKVYYNGIKSLELTKNNFNINDALFIPNASNIGNGKNKIYSEFETMPSNVEKVFKEISEFFTFQIGEIKSKKVDINFSTRKDLASNIELENKINRVIDNGFNEYFDKVKVSSRTSTSLYLKDKIKDEITNYHELYKIIYTFLKFTVEDKNFKKIDFNVKLKLKDDIKIDNNLLDEIDRILESRINLYISNSDTKIENDYNESKSNENQEKQKQQKLMNIFSEGRKKIFYEAKEGKEEVLFSENTYPFEMEYTIYVGVNKDAYYKGIDKRSDSNIKGRIDNIFIDGNTINLIEVKYGDNVIDGTNGIHKHLIDLNTCINLNNTIRDEIETFVNMRIDKLNDVGINYISKEHILLKDEMKYYIICIYNNNGGQGLDKNSVIKKLDNIYLKNCIEAGCNISENKMKEDSKNPNIYDEILVYENVEQLVNRLTNNNCKVKIILVDEEFKKFEEYIIKNLIGEG